MLGLSSAHKYKSSFSYEKEGPAGLCQMDKYVLQYLQAPFPKYLHSK